MPTVEITPTSVEPLRRTITTSAAPGGLTGATVRCDVSRMAAGVFQLLDFADATFKVPASVGTRYRALAEVSAGNAPGLYAAATSLDVATIVGGVAAGDAMTVTYYMTAPLTATLDADELRVVAPGATAAAVAAVQASVTAAQGVGFTAGMDDLHSIRARGDAAWITGSGWAVPGDAMTLTAGERTAIQAKIIDDATPFHGASIAVIRAFGAPPSAAANAAAVWATAEGGTEGDMQYALTTLYYRQIYRRKLGLDGYELIYGPGGTVVKKVRVLDVNGDPVVPSPGDPAEVTAEQDP